MRMLVFDRRTVRFAAVALCCVSLGFTVFAVLPSSAVAQNRPGEPLAMPLPDRNPSQITEPETPSPPHPGELAAPEWTAQEIQSAQEQCSMMLDDMGFSYKLLDPVREGVCGTPVPIELSSIGQSPPVQIEPPARVTCGLAASLGTWADTSLQTIAREHLGEPIVALRNVASYVCRNRYNSADKPVSEHARANALDIAAFKTAAGRWIPVLGNWTLPEPPQASSPSPSPETVSGVTSLPPANRSADGDKTEPGPSEEEIDLLPETAFIREIHTAACSLFGTVLGPDANKAHEDHFHFDLAARNYGNYCE